MNQSLKKKLQNNQLTVGSWLAFAHPSIAEIMCNAGFEWVVIDMEHSSITLQQAEELIRIIDLKGSAPLVRLPDNDPIIAKRIMDSGAHGIVVPMINSKEEAQKAFKAIHYPPTGTRGVGLARAQQYGANFHGYRKDLENDGILIVQIEHIKAVENLEEIFSVPGVDGYIIGPYDLSASMGIPGEFDNPDFIKALNKVSDVAKKMNKTAGIHVVEPNLQELDPRIEEGYRFIAYSVDMRMLDVACRKAMKHINNK